MKNAVTTALHSIPDNTGAHASGLKLRALEWLSTMKLTEGMSVLEVECDAWSSGDCYYPDSSVDVIIALNALDHFVFDRWLIQEFWRVLKPGGRLIVAVADKPPVRIDISGWPIRGRRRLGRWLAQAVVFTSGWLPGQHRSASEATVFDCRRYRRDEFCELLNNNCFVVEEHCVVEAQSLIRPHRHLFMCRKVEDDYRGGSKPFSDIDLVAGIVEEENAGAFDRLSRLRVDQVPELSDMTLRYAEDTFAESERWLVLSPHPDDEIIGCGGTLLKAAAQNKDITVVQMTDGSASSALSGMPEEYRKNVRLKEAATVAAKLRCRLELFGGSDGNLSVSKDATERMTKILSQARPDVIFVPFINDPHPDHVATNEILVPALGSVNWGTAPLIVSYEVWSLVPGNTISRIDEQMDEKCRLLRDYRIPMRVKDYVRYCRSLHAFHSLSLLREPGFAEMFLTLTMRDYFAMVGRSLRGPRGQIMVS